MHCDAGGPTCRPVLDPSNGINRQGIQPPPSISTIRTDVPSGERADRCAIPPSIGGRVQATALATTLCRCDDAHMNTGHHLRVHRAARIDRDEPRCVWKKRPRRTAKHRHLPGVPAEPGHDRRINNARAVRRKYRLLLVEQSRVSSTGSPLGKSFTCTCPRSAESPKVPPRINVSMRPSADNAGATAESLKSVSWMGCAGADRSDARRKTSAATTTQAITSAAEMTHTTRVRCGPVDSSVARANGTSPMSRSRR